MMAYRSNYLRPEILHPYRSHRPLVPESDARKVPHNIKHPGSGIEQISLTSRYIYICIYIRPLKYGRPSNERIFQGGGAEAYFMSVAQGRSTGDEVLGESHKVTHLT